MWRRLFWFVVGTGVALVVVGAVEPVYVFGPLLGLLIWRIGTASLHSLAQGASFVPDGDPTPVDPSQERTVYWCAGCGAELLLLVRGSQSPPRHCGERMTQREEIAPHALGESPPPQP